MESILLATLAYLLGACVVILDKFLLGSKRISSPSVYAFYVGLTGMGVFLFAPIGFIFPAFQLYIPNLQQFLLAVISGILYLAGLLALYQAINKSEASKVTPVVFSVIPLVTFILLGMLGDEKHAPIGIFGVLLLIFGGLLISFDLPLKLKKRKFFAGFYYSLLSGLLQAVSLVLLKQVYEELTFFNGFAWSRFGSFVGIGMLLMVPAWKKNIFRSFRHAKKEKKKNTQTAGLFAINKIMGGSSSALVNFAVALGSVTIVSAMVSLQYVFVLLLALLGGKHLPNIFEERLYFWDWFQKVVAIAIIAIGIYFITI